MAAQHGSVLRFGLTKGIQHTSHRQFLISKIQVLIFVFQCGRILFLARWVGYERSGSRLSRRTLILTVSTFAMLLSITTVQKERDNSRSSSSQVVVDRKK